ncbi:hypothetical protein V1477_009923 [Vespula maculifrons]|uniref:Transmembrane protein n=1 Tax=Vespula maculifrons TaxID=7453 RepID=A0ABD2CBF1_VESMC
MKDRLRRGHLNKWKDYSVGVSYRVFLLSNSILSRRSGPKCNSMVLLVEDKSGGNMGEGSNYLYRRQSWLLFNLRGTCLSIFVHYSNFENFSHEDKIEDRKKSDSKESEKKSEEKKKEKDKVVVVVVVVVFVVVFNSQQSQFLRNYRNVSSRKMFNRIEIISFPRMSVGGGVWTMGLWQEVGVRVRIVFMWITFLTSVTRKLVSKHETYYLMTRYIRLKDQSNNVSREFYDEGA